MPADSFLRLLQFSDGLFPAGGYAHSFGLETLGQSGRVQNARDITAFLRAYLEGSAAPTDAVAVLCARKYALADDLDACIRLDHYLDAFKSAAELRDASRQMGRQTLRVLNELAKIGDCHSERAERTTEGRTPSDEESLFAAGAGHGPLICHPERSDSAIEGSAFSVSRGVASALAPEDLPSHANEHSRFDSCSHSPLATSHFLSRFASAVESGVTPCNHSVVFGLAAAANTWEPRETASAFLYSTSAMIVGVSLRLLPLGQLAGQRILAEAGSLIAVLSETVLDKTEENMWSFTPELEIAAMRHESLDGRLFRS